MMNCENDIFVGNIHELIGSIFLTIIVVDMIAWLTRIHDTLIVITRYFSVVRKFGLAINLVRTTLGDIIGKTHAISFEKSRFAAIGHTNTFFTLSFLCTPYCIAILKVLAAIGHGIIGAFLPVRFSNRNQMKSYFACSCTALAF